MTDSNASAYTPIPILRTPAINPGEDITVDLFISGAGDVEWCYLTILHAHPEIIDPRESGEIIPSVHVYDNKVLCGLEKLEEEVGDQELSVNQTGVRLGIDRELLTQESGEDLGPLERTHPLDDGDPPYRLELKTVDDAPLGGNYEISFVLVYKTAEEIVTTRETVKVHVKTSSERYSKEIAIATIISAAIALISLIYSTGLFGAVLEFIYLCAEYLKDVLSNSSIRSLLIGYHHTLD